MLKPKTTPISQHQHQETLPECFTLLTWNLQKVDFFHYIHRPIESLLSIPKVHLLSLQEAVIKPEQNRFFNLPFFMAPNIETKKQFYGVVTASNYYQSAFSQQLTQSRELGVMTHKAALVTQHRLNNGQTLTHVNIHAINFVPHHIFKAELLLLWNNIRLTQGPLIVSGDFNTWNKMRLNTLLKATKQLNLSQVVFSDSQAIKTLNRHPLDYIFYRDLSMRDAVVLSVPEISDHNPLIASFSPTHR